MDLGSDMSKLNYEKSTHMPTFNFKSTKKISRALKF